jgi:hypothetical protein
MLKPLLFTTLLILAQKEEKPPQTGIIAGAVAAPEGGFSQPVQVILLSPKYEELWNSDVQKRLDGYWERFKPAFAQQKEIFLEATKMAYRESTQFVITRMRLDLQGQTANFIQQSSLDGRFEFKGVPTGEYKVLAVGKIGTQEVIWQESVKISNSIPQFLQLKKLVP